MSRRLKAAEKVFPNLAVDGYEKNIQESVSYNCIAFAAGDIDHIWDGFGDPPDGYWPTPDTGAHITHLISALRADGFEECSGPELEPGYEKVALYKSPNDKWTHAARLRDDGYWESKLGKKEDINHKSPEALAGDTYGKVALYMRRTITKRVRMRLSRWLANKKKAGPRPEETAS